MYGWIITKDHYPEGREGTNSNAKGMSGPSHIHAGMFERLQTEGQGEEFRMLDDDGNLYYEGRLLGDPAAGVSGFEPLDDFGAPNAGCTSIQYRNADTGKWETL